MKNLNKIRFTILCIGMLLIGCARPVSLKYNSNVFSSQKQRISTKNKVAIFMFVDDREDIDPKVYGESLRPNPILPLVLGFDMEAEQRIDEYVTMAFKVNLTQLGVGAEINNNPLLKQQVNLHNYKDIMDKNISSLNQTEKAIIGRIRFFRLTQAETDSSCLGAVASEVLSPPSPRFVVEIHVQLVNIKDKTVRWAGSGWSLKKLPESYDPEQPDPAIVENIIEIGLRDALSKIFSNRIFINAISS